MIDGAKAERIAADFLRKKHYQLLDYNYRTRFGEIDLICKKIKYIVFVEVKKRSVNTIAAPREFVDERKQQKIVLTAEDYLQRYTTELQPRFDVVEIICDNDKVKSVKHLENAFEIR